MKESTVERRENFQNQVEEKHVDNWGRTGGKRKKEKKLEQSLSVKIANIFIKSAAD